MYFSKKKIVAVDDSAIILKTIERILGKRYDLHCFSSAARALQFLDDKDRTPDLILLDIDMPDMDGYEMLEKLKRNDALKSVPVIFLTSNNDKKYVMKAIADGISDYVVKPIAEDILIDRINSLLGE